MTALEWHTCAYVSLSISYSENNPSFRTPEDYNGVAPFPTLHAVAAGLSHIEEYMILSMKLPSKMEELKNAVFPDVFLVDYVKVYDRKPDAGLPAP